MLQTDRHSQTILHGYAGVFIWIYSNGCFC